MHVPRAIRCLTTILATVFLSGCFLMSRQEEKRSSAPALEKPVEVEPVVAEPEPAPAEPVVAEEETSPPPVPDEPMEEKPSKKKIGKKKAMKTAEELAEERRKKIEALHEESGVLKMIGGMKSGEEGDGYGILKGTQ